MPALSALALLAAIVLSLLFLSNGKASGFNPLIQVAIIAVLFVAAGVIWWLTDLFTGIYISILIFLEGVCMVWPILLTLICVVVFFRIIKRRGR